jgi:SAM-dependent methyltransferase
MMKLMDITTIYDDLYETHGDTRKGFGWNIDSVREIFYKTALMITQWEGQSLLDVGCGTGEMLSYIKDHELNVDYKGLDINHQFVSDAKDRFPKGSFFQGDVAQIPTAAKADYLIACGTFNITADEGKKYEVVSGALKSMFEGCNKGIGGVFASDRGRDIKAPHTSYDSDEILQIGKSLTPYFQLNHHFSKDFFTIFLYK